MSEVDLARDDGYAPADNFYDDYTISYPPPKPDVLHPFTGYNKTDVASTLVGNWVEERHLKDLTGTIRCGTQLADENASQSLYATRVKPPVQLMATHPRVIEHSSQLNPADWESTYRISYDNPKLIAALLEFRTMPKAGPRETLELAKLLAAAHELNESEIRLFQEEINRSHFSTTQKSSYRGVDVTGMKVGAKVMKDPDGRPAQRDPTFLVETRIMKREQADSLFPKEAKEHGALGTTTLLSPDIPITIYSESAATGKYGSTFQGTQITGANPFGKQTNFSKPISEYNKVVIDE